MKAEHGIFGLLAIIGSITAVSFLCMTSAFMTRTLAVLFDELPGFVIAAKIAVIAVAVFAIVKGGIHLLTAWNERNHVWPDHAGVLPMVKGGEDYVNHTPPAVALIAAIMGDKKPTAAVARGLLRAGLGQYGTEQVNGEWEVVEPPALEAGTGQFDIGRVDPRTAPHWLFIGQTGSGKSTAAYTVLDQLRQRHNAEFNLCEPGGVDWNRQADHIEYDDIATAIAGEYEVMRERQGYLREHDVSHIADLPESIPYRYLVLEEADSLFDNLNRDRAKDALFHLRELARMGRKTGIGLIALSQTALADVFNTHVRGNLNNVFLFRGSQQIARNWGVSKLVDLPSLPPGRAYDLAYERTIQFPNAARPDLQNGATNSVVRPVVQPVATATTAVDAYSQRLAKGRKPSPAVAKAMRQLHAGGMSKTKICFRFWDYKDGVVWSHLNDALENRI